MTVFDRKKHLGLDWYLGGLIFLLLMLRNCAWGIQYWPQLDDYIQYHNYAAEFTFAQLQELTGLLASRPLAGLADYFVWSPLFDRMILAVTLLSAMYAICVVWMKKLMERYVAVGPVFFVVMGLLPLGVEGTYWVSASARIVCGLFAACLTALAFGRWLDTGKGSVAAVFALLMPIPFGFYEQSAVLAMTLVFGMAVLHWNQNWKRALLALWVIPAAGLYFAVTGHFADGGVYSSRAELVLPGSDYYRDVFLPDILGQLKTVFVDANHSILVNGFVRTVKELRSVERLLWVVLVIAVCALFARLAKQTGGGGKRKTALALLIGVLLAVAPVTPFLILANPWFSLRGAVTSFAGIALCCDGLIMALWRWLPFRKRGPALLAAGLAFVFCLAGASEVRDYRETCLDDQNAARAVLDQLEADGLKGEKAQNLRVGVLGVEPSFLEEQNFPWHEHIHGCTESSWAFAGLMTSLDLEKDRPSVTPLPTDPIYRRWNAETNRPQTFDVLYWYDGEALIPVELKQDGTAEYEVWADSEPIGRVWEDENGIGYFRLG